MLEKIREAIEKERENIFLIAFFLLVILAIVFAWLWAGRAKEGSGGEPLVVSPEKRITVTPVSKKDIKQKIYLSGQVKALKTVPVFGRLTVPIEKIYVSVGSKVKVGANLLKFDEQKIKFKVEKARIQYEIAKAQLSKVRSNPNRSSADIAIASQRVNAAKADYEIAKSDLKYIYVKSPITGIVSKINVFTGQTPNVSSPLIVVADTSSFVIETQVDEKQGVFVKAGAPATVRFASIPDKVFRGKVTSIGISASQSGVPRNFIPIQIKLNPGKYNFLRDGLRGAKITLEATKNVLAVPRSALVNKEGRTSVFVVTLDRRAIERPVKTGISAEDYVEIVAGLNEDETVAATGVAGLESGDKVRW